MANNSIKTEEERERELALASSRNVQQAVSSSNTDQGLPKPRVTETEQADTRRENERQSNAARLQQTAQTAATTAEAAGATMEAGGAIAQGAGKLTSVAGEGMEAAGRAAMSGGRAMMQGGVALSETGVGAILGVPLAVAGGATAVVGGVGVGAGKASEAVGRGVEAGGRATRAAGANVRRTGNELRQMSGGANAPLRMPGGMNALAPAGFPASGGFLSGGAQQSMAKSVTDQAKQIPGVGAMVDKAGAIVQDFQELIPAFSVIGIIPFMFRLHHRLIWGNLMNGTIFNAKPLTMPWFWAAVAAVLDALLLALSLFLAFGIYAITNPCEVLSEVIAGKLPTEFSFLRSTMQSICPEKLLQNAVQ